MQRNARIDEDKYEMFCTLFVRRDTAVRFLQKFSFWKNEMQIYV